MQAMVHGHKPPKLNPTIYLYNANFSGSIPDSWSGMSSMQTLQMFVNSLTGTLPAAFGNFAQLISLNVAFNNFTGDVPVLASSKLRAVQSIVLQDNPHLSGEISLSWNNIWTFGAVCNICRTKICGPRLSMMTFGYGCLPQSALSLLASPVTISTIAKLSAASTFVDNVSCPSSVTPRSLTTSRSDIYVVPHDSAIPIVPVVSASGCAVGERSCSNAGASCIFWCASRFAGGARCTAPASRMCCGTVDGTDNNTGADSCCDASTSPSQLVLESVDSSYPQFAGAVVGNTIIVVAYGCVRTLLRLGLRSASSSHFFCSHLMELVDTTNVATIWPVFTSSIR
ncbi:GP46-like surface antigen, putative [Bodo saltans]|uniref:GP46-like surface antigen, putative n=1 Tax=Bodo saltans TaxID=75058 RepID=A0A0S4JAN4_BODSA|nr:GP46-like surface antigen, putative [Bodo saltans]|eukprot:CUG87402.1 GP46-like surface antigen, putative [Bodo saltans]